MAMNNISNEGKQGFIETHTKTTQMEKQQDSSFVHKTQNYFLSLVCN